ncbi:MAG: ABC transporter substrate-binding protein [Armatimonadota bacterium]|nr:ABC transporter substrate-binding protein [Armatimonadota bacterium]
MHRRRSQRVSRTGVGILLVSLALTITGTTPALPAPTVTPVRGGTLTIAYVALATHIDVNSANLSTVNELAHQFYETLYDRDGTGRVRGLLVREDSVSPDGMTVTMRLQSNVRFHDGTPFNAAAVKWNLDRKIQKRQPLFDLLPFRSIEVVDDLTVRVAMTRPAPNFRSILSTKTFSMYSPAFAQRVGDDGLKQQASGTGPFTVAEFRPNEIVRLSRNPNYWQQGLPYLDEVIYRIVPNINTRATMLEAGDVDMALALSIPDLQRLKARRGIKVLEALGSQQYYITINNRKPPLNDVRVRRALNHAVDKDGIIKTVMLGTARPATAVYLNSAVDGYAPAGTYKYDPEMAKKLLDEAGWTMGPGGVRQQGGRPLSLELVTRKGGTPGDFEIAELVQGMLKAVGVDVRLTVLESATFVPRVTLPPERATYDLVNLAVGVFTGDAEYIMLTFYHSSSAAPRYFNRAYYANPVVDGLIEESIKATTSPGRNKIYYAQIVKQVFQDAPIIMLFDVVQQIAVKDTVHGVYLEGAGNNWPVKYAWKERR